MDTRLTTRPNGNGGALALPDEEFIRYQQMIARLKTLVTNGRKLSDEQAEGLAAFAAAEKLDPFTGECYMMVDKDGRTLGPVVGIKGIRRKSQEQLGDDSHILLDFQAIACPPGVRHAWECRLRDTKTMKAWGDMYASLKTAGMDHDTIKEAIGPAPVYIGIGYFYEAEKSDYKDMKYNPNEKAKKRAEAAARKLRFSLPYNFGDNGGDGGGVVVGEPEMGPDDVIVEAVEVQPEKPARSEADNLRELGFDQPVEAEYVDAEPEAVSERASPYADLIFQAQSDPTTAFWLLQKRIGMDKVAAQAIVKENGSNFAAAFPALLKQAPPF